MIRPIIEYAPSVWSPHLQRDILKLESVQHRSARFVLNDYARLSSVTGSYVAEVRMANSQTTQG